MVHEDVNGYVEDAGRDIGDKYEPMYYDQWKFTFMLLLTAFFYFFFTSMKYFTF